jgi:hypothetical protein
MHWYEAAIVYAVLWLHFFTHHYSRVLSGFRLVGRRRSRDMFLRISKSVCAHVKLHRNPLSRKGNSEGGATAIGFPRVDPRGN